MNFWTSAGRYYHILPKYLQKGERQSQIDDQRSSSTHNVTSEALPSMISSRRSISPKFYEKNFFFVAIYSSKKHLTPLI